MHQCRLYLFLWHFNFDNEYVLCVKYSTIIFHVYIRVQSEYYYFNESYMYIVY